MTFAELEPPMVQPDVPEDQTSSSGSSIQSEIRLQIKNILANNQVEDLKKFIKERETLNIRTEWLMYSSYIFQSSGIFITTLATGYKIDQLTWVGIGLNMVSTLCIVFEKLNASISNRMMKDIMAIKTGSYVDQGVIEDDIQKKD
jgi:hypothetical protein